jgi:AcrR family transcriptional regulator
MDNTPAKEKPFRKQSAVRYGRPPRERAGEVEARILEAARHLFLERGLAGTSVEEIAALARAGKPTIYTRFPGKEALFAAVMMRTVAANIAGFQASVPAGENMEERLASLGAAMLHWVFNSDSVELLRLAIAEGRRFPDLAIRIHLMARERGAEAVARFLGEVAHADELGGLPAFAPARLAITTRFFIDLVLLPPLMRALLGEKLKPLRAEIGPHVARSVAFFLAACRNGGVS